MARKKTPIQNYAKLIEGIFGSGTALFDITKNHSNNIIGGLNHQGNYSRFKKNFKARLIRLKNIYAASPSYLKEILTQVNEIASEKNWEGAFAELVAYDHLNQDILDRKTHIHTPIRPNVTIDVRKTYGFELGKKAANLDGFIEDRPLYFDVKCFKDNVTEILEGIYRDLKRHLASSAFHVFAEHALDIAYDDFQNNRNKLLNELKTEFSPPKRPTFIRSSIIKGLTFSVQWTAGIHTAFRTYEPYRHAQNYHRTIFNYADKFVKGEHTLIVLVIFPWYNHIITDFANSNVQFYRSLCRRVFCQYKNDTTPFKIFNSNFSGNETIYEVSNQLSGIIFLEDHSILGKDPKKTNVKSFVYLNPNATKPINRSLVREFIMGLHNSEYDDFENDNY